MRFTYKGKNYTFERYPKSENRSLKAWSAADEHLLKYIDENNIPFSQPVIYNDRFGFLSTIFSEQLPNAVINFKSQEKALDINLKMHNIDRNNVNKINPLEEPNLSSELSLIKVPKSLELFRLQLYQAQKLLNDKGVILCAFMTKYFSPQILSIAEEYFEQCEQSKAWKKSRILILKKKKKILKQEFINSIPYSESKNFNQYYGVFSAKNIDYATQFLIENINVKPTDNVILDLASGNGILAYVTLTKKPDSEIHLLDDSFLAIASSKMNLDTKKTHFHYNDSLSDFENNTFDLIISNPPFHFEHETNIEVTLELFNQVKRCLKDKGCFQLVTSKHLNLKTHLVKLFNKMIIVNQNEKFIIYLCAEPI